MFGGETVHIVLRGWKRVVYDHDLMKQDISELRPSNPEFYGPDEVFLETSNAGLCIRSGVRDLAIQGNFQVEIELTKREIINLARIALAEEPFGRVIRGFSRRRK